METVFIYSSIALLLAIGAFFPTRFFIKSMAMRDDYISCRGVAGVGLVVDDWVRGSDKSLEFHTSIE